MFKQKKFLYLLHRQLLFIICTLSGFKKIYYSGFYKAIALIKAFCYAIIF